MFESAMFMELVEMFCKRAAEGVNPMPGHIHDGGAVRELTPLEEGFACQFIALGAKAHAQGVDLGRVALAKLQRKKHEA